MDIDIFVVYNEGILPYVNLMKKSCETFKSGLHKLNWKAYICGEECPAPKGFKLCGWVKDLNHNSMSHALALKQLPR